MLSFFLARLFLRMHSWDACALRSVCGYSRQPSSLLRFDTQGLWPSELFITISPWFVLFFMSSLMKYQSKR